MSNAEIIVSDKRFSEKIIKSEETLYDNNGKEIYSVFEYMTNIMMDRELTIFKKVLKVIPKEHQNEKTLKTLSKCFGWKMSSKEKYE